MKLALVFLFPLLLSAQTKSIRLEERSLPEIELRDVRVSDFAESQTLYSSLPNNLKRFYLLVNYARVNPHKFYDSIVSPLLEVYPQFKGQYSESLKIDLFNQPKLPLLKLNLKLLGLSNDHANDIVKHNQQASHTASNGESFQQRIKDAGIRDCAGENICVGQGDVVFSVFLLYLDYQLPDLGHRKALMNPFFTETGIGIGYYQNEQYFIVEDFACQQ